MLVKPPMVKAADRIVIQPAIGASMFWKLQLGVSLLSAVCGGTGSIAFVMAGALTPLGQAVFMGSSVMSGVGAVLLIGLVARMGRQHD